MKIKLNPEQEIVNTIREGLNRTGGYCPCGRPLSCYGHSVCRGTGLIQAVQSLIGWRSSASAFIASC